MSVDTLTANAVVTDPATVAMRDALAIAETHEGDADLIRAKALADWSSATGESFRAACRMAKVLGFGSLNATRLGRTAAILERLPKLDKHQRADLATAIRAGKETGWQTVANALDDPTTSPAEVATALAKGAEEYRSFLSVQAMAEQSAEQAEEQAKQAEQERVAGLTDAERLVEEAAAHLAAHDEALAQAEQSHGEAFSATLNALSVVKSSLTALDDSQLSALVKMCHEVADMAQDVADKRA